MNNCSYGFRPGRNAHEALTAVREGLQAGLRVALDADLSNYSDTIPPLQMRIQYGGLHEPVSRCSEPGPPTAGIKGGPCWANQAVTC